MLVFATEFTTAEGATASDFLNVCRKWLVGSPRYPWKEDDFLSSNEIKEIEEFEKDSFQVSTAFIDSSSARISAMQLRYTDDRNLEWVTELVGGETNGRLLASVRVHCAALQTGAEIPWARKPFIVGQILDQLGGGQDGQLTIIDKPHFLDESNLDIAEGIMKGHLGNRLPIVYLSSSTDSTTQLNVEKLANRLSGMAHIIVEPSEEFSRRLSSRVNRANVYGGAIGVYWPDGAAFEKTFVGPRGPGPTERFLEVRVQNALCQSQPTDLSTWMAVRALIASQRVATLRESGNDDINEWIDAFDEERQSLEAQLSEARFQVASLSAQLRGIKFSGESGGMLPIGAEEDLFPGERAEIVQSMLRDALSKVESGSRTEHVLKDLVLEGVVQRRIEFSEAIKNVLHDKKNIGSDEIAEMKHLGFSMTDDGKHYKAVFKEDPRYTFTLHKTASDHRTPMNLVSMINRKLFK